MMGALWAELLRGTILRISLDIELESVTLRTASADWPRRTLTTYFGAIIFTRVPGGNL